MKNFTLIGSGEYIPLSVPILVNYKVHTIVMIQSRTTESNFIYPKT